MEQLCWQLRTSLLMTLHDLKIYIFPKQHQTGATRPDCPETVRIVSIGYLIMGGELAGLDFMRSFDPLMCRGAPLPS